MASLAKISSGILFGRRGIFRTFPFRKFHLAWIGVIGRIIASFWAKFVILHALAMWLHVILGVIVAVLAAIQLWIVNRSPPEVAA